MTFEASGSGGRADCNNEGAIIFFSVLKDFSSGGCGNIFENLDRPLAGVVGKFDDISIEPAKGHLRYSLAGPCGVLWDSQSNPWPPGPLQRQTNLDV